VRKTFSRTQLLRFTAKQRVELIVGVHGPIYQKEAGSMYMPPCYLGYLLYHVSRTPK
jgi:hypothetical protein